MNFSFHFLFFSFLFFSFHFCHVLLAPNHLFCRYYIRLNFRFKYFITCVMPRACATSCVVSWLFINIVNKVARLPKWKKKVSSHVSPLNPLCAAFIRPEYWATHLDCLLSKYGTVTRPMVFVRI